MPFDREQIYTVAGFSMEPLLSNGDLIKLEPSGRTGIRPGDIVAFEDESGNLIVHRVKEVTPRLITQGDNNLNPDGQLPPEALLAKLIGVEHSGKVFTPEQGKAGLKVFLRHQQRAKIFKMRERFGRFICRILPCKIGEHQLRTVEFGNTTIYYWHGHAIGTYWKGTWLFLWWPAAFFIRRPRKIRTVPLAGLLGAIAAGGGMEEAAKLPPERLLNCCESGRRFGFAPLIYYALSEALPPPVKEQFQLEYYAARAREIPNRMAIELITDKLSERKIPFIWLKGGWLAYNVYPSACTRYMRDLDLLIRREDAEAVFELLTGDGWRPRERDMRRKRSLFYRHHLPSLSREGFPELELHWHIFKDISINPAKLWEYANPSGCGSEYRFLPEIHYLLAIYNGYIDSWEYGFRSMLDLALMQKKFTLDPEFLRKLNSDLKLELDLGLAYAAFPEFFNGKERLFTSKLPPDVIAAIRSLASDDRINSVASLLPNKRVNWMTAICEKLYNKIHPKWHKYLFIRNRVTKRDLLILSRKLPRFSDLRLEARQSHGRF